jgi:hypothetical protein
MSSITEEETILADIAAAEAVALQDVECEEDYTLDTEILFRAAKDLGLSIESHLNMLEEAYTVHKHMLKLFERHWALTILKDVAPQFAIPAINIFMRNMCATEPWTIPERIYASDIWSAYTPLAKMAAKREARLKLFKKWEKEAIAKAEKEAREKVADNHPSCVADMMAEVAGWQAADALNAKLKNL